MLPPATALPRVTERRAAASFEDAKRFSTDLPAGEQSEA